MDSFHVKIEFLYFNPDDCVELRFFLITKWFLDFDFRFLWFLWMKNIFFSQLDSYAARLNFISFFTLSTVEFVCCNLHDRMKEKKCMSIAIFSWKNFSVEFFFPVDDLLRLIKGRRVELIKWQTHNSQLIINSQLISTKKMFSKHENIFVWNIFDLRHIVHFLYSNYLRLEWTNDDMR